MAVSVKKRPAVPNIQGSLNMISGDSSPVQQEQAFVPAQQIQTVAPANNNNLQTPSEIKKSTKDTQIIFRTTEDNKNSLKGFFASHGITLSKGIQLACFYLEQQIKAGSVEINSAGLITKQDRR